MTKNPGSSVRLHLFTGITAVSTMILIAVGAMVTSTGSGLAVPDWPLSYGMFMPPMVGGIFYEHGHRMVASFVGFLTVILTVWAWRVESRNWVKRLAVVALGVVILQGLLGGLTVIYLLPTPVSVSHACLAQTFLCIVITLWLVTSKSWVDSKSIIVDEDGLSTRWVAIFVGMTVYIQLILGALIRHTESALVIPDFPLAFGHLFPPIFDLTTNPTAPYPVGIEVLRLQVLIQFMHRVWAIIVCASVIWLIARIMRTHISIGHLVRPAFLLGALTVFQVLLGASIIWSGRAVWVATGHVVAGAGILSTTVVIILRCWRLSERHNAEGTVETTLAEGSAA